MHRWAVRRAEPGRWTVHNQAGVVVAWSRDRVAALDYAHREARRQSTLVRIDDWLRDAS